MVQALTVGLLLYLLTDSEKWDLKLCVYKTPFGKSTWSHMEIDIRVSVFLINKAVFDNFSLL